tara:strand:+ start:968 stop:1123 length:156 start_codon:yes stop_codon:yes gene_type:complete
MKKFKSFIEDKNLDDFEEEILGPGLGTNKPMASLKTNKKSENKDKEETEEE